MWRWLMRWSGPVIGWWSLSCVVGCRSPMRCCRISVSCWVRNWVTPAALTWSPITGLVDVIYTRVGEVSEGSPPAVLSDVYRPCTRVGSPGRVCQRPSATQRAAEVRSVLAEQLPPTWCPRRSWSRRVAVDGQRQGGYRALPAPNTPAPAGTGRRPPPSRRFWPGSTPRSSDSSGSGWMIRSSTSVGIRCRRCG